jgi:hypothetical protein
VVFSKLYYKKRRYWTVRKERRRFVVMVTMNDVIRRWAQIDLSSVSIHWLIRYLKKTCMMIRM